MIEPQLASELQEMRASRPGEVVNHLDVPVAVDERRFGVIAEARESADADARHAPRIGRNVGRQLQPGLGNRIPHVVQLATRMVEERIDANPELVHQRRRQHAGVVDDALLTRGVDDRAVEIEPTGIDVFVRPAVAPVPRRLRALCEVDTCRELVLVCMVLIDRKIIVCQARRRLVRLGIELHEPERNGTHPIFRDDVPRKLPAGERIDNRRADAGQIAVAHRHRGHGEEALFLIAKPEAFVIPHEEELVFAVEPLAELNGTAEREPVLIPLERTRRGHTAGKRVRQRVEFVVAQKFEDRAVIRVAARLGRHAHLAQLAPKLGRVHPGLHFEFLQRIDRRQEDVRIEVHIRVINAVQREVIPLAPTAADRQLLRRPIAALTWT